MHNGGVTEAQSTHKIQLCVGASLTSAKKFVTTYREPVSISGSEYEEDISLSCSSSLTTKTKLLLMTTETIRKAILKTMMMANKL